MNAKKLLPVLITLIFTASALCLPQEEKTELSNTMHASCVIKVVTTGDLVPRDDRSLRETIVFTLKSSNVGGKAAKEILGITPKADFWHHLIVYSVSMTEGPDDIYTNTVGLSIDLENVEPAPAPAAEEFLFALVEEFRQSLNKSYKDSQRILAQQIALAQGNADYMEARLRNLQDEQADLRARSGLPNLSRDAILKDANNMKTKIAEEEFNLSSMDWRHDSVFEQIRFFRERIQEETLDSNIVLKGLEELIDLHQKRLDTVNKQVEEGHVSADKIVEAEEKLARAKIELAQKKQQIKDNAGGNKIDQLKFQLNNFEIEKAETNKKIKYLHSRLGSTEALLRHADTYEILSLKVQVAKNALKNALYKLEEMKQQLNTMAPAVILVGSE